jgi:hypothetical protein
MHELVRRRSAGRLEHAAALYLESLAGAQERDIALLVATSLLGLAGVAAEVGRPETGARLFGAAEGIWAFLGASMFPRDRPVSERALAALTQILGEERLIILAEQGRALTIEEAIDAAIAVGEAVEQAECTSHGGHAQSVSG